MKKGKGFISNSSSSSFTCDICGCTGSGWDASASDFDMTSCEAGHTYCNNEAVDASTEEQYKAVIVYENKQVDHYKECVKESGDKEYYKKDVAEHEEKLKAAEEHIKELDEGWLEDWHEEYKEETDETFSSFCPLCTLDRIQDSNILAYVTKSLGLNEIETEIREKFKSLDELKAFLKD